MSSASHAQPGRPTFGGLLIRIIIIGLIWAGLVAGLLHYLGHVIPVAYQVSQAEAEEADRLAHAALTPPPAASATASATPAASAPATSAVTSAAPVTAAAPMTSATPVASTPTASVASTATLATSALAAGTAAPAGSAAGAAPAPKAATGAKTLPYDLRLAGFNRTALTNVAIFYSIVTSVVCIGAIILQLFKYCHREEETAH